MNAEMNFKRNQIDFASEESESKADLMSGMTEAGVVSERCNCSIYSMLAVAGGVLLAIGSVVYSIIAM